ncbi:MAG: hypothetical protein ACREXR_16645, partial [Gammaproteobacteria bacterium]
FARHHRDAGPILSNSAIKTLGGFHQRVSRHFVLGISLQDPDTGHFELIEVPTVWLSANSRA